MRGDTVFWGVGARIGLDLTFPMANRPRSKKRTIPRKRKTTPKPDRPMPISTRERNEAVSH